MLKKIKKRKHFKAKAYAYLSLQFYFDKNQTLQFKVTCNPHKNCKLSDKFGDQYGFAKFFVGYCEFLDHADKKWCVELFDLVKRELA